MIKLFGAEVLKNAIGVLETTIEVTKECGQEPSVFEMIQLSFLKELKEYREICDDPKKLKVVDDLFLEKCEEVNRLKAELAEYKKMEEYNQGWIPCSERLEKSGV